MKSKVISISAIASAFVAICLTIGAYIEFADLFVIVISSAFVILPFYYKSYKGCVLAYLCGGVLAFLLSGFNVFSVVFPSYFAFFGLYPIIRQICVDKRINKILYFAIGLVWFVATVYGMFFYYTLVMGELFSDLPEFILKNVLWILPIVAVFVFFIYERFVFVVRVFTDRYLGRIIK